MSLWHRIKVRLGLGDDWDEEYDDEYDDRYDEGPRRDSRGRSDGQSGRSAYASPYAEATTSVRRVARDHDLDSARDYEGYRSNEGARLRSVPAAGGVAPLKPQLKMAIIEPKSFTEAQLIADKFKKGTPVILNMSLCKPDLAKRMIDFSSGLTYGLDGGLQKISEKVFMLTPANVDVSAEDKRRLRDTGLFTME